MKNLLIAVLLLIAGMAYSQSSVVLSVTKTDGGEEAIAANEIRFITQNATSTNIEVGYGPTKRTYVVSTPYNTLITQSCGNAIPVTVTFQGQPKEICFNPTWVDRIIKKPSGKGSIVMKQSNAIYDSDIAYAALANTFKNCGSGGGGGGGSATNISITNITGTNFTIASSTGADAVAPAATPSAAGVMSATDKTKIDNITVTGPVNLDNIAANSHSPVSTTNTTTVQHVLTGQSLASNVRSNSLDSNYIKDGGISLRDLNQTGATVNQVIKWNGTRWAPAADGGGSGGSTFDTLFVDSGNQQLVIAGPTDTLRVDIINISPVQAISGIEGVQVTANPGGSYVVKLSQQGAVAGQVLKWSGTAWIPGTDDTGMAATIDSVRVASTSSGVTVKVNNTTSPAHKILPSALAQQSATTNQGLVWNGTIWAPATIDVDPADDIKIGDAAGGDLGGTYPNPSVFRIRGVPLAAVAPTTGQILTFDGTNWTPTAALVQDVNGSASITVTESPTGTFAIALAQNGATSGQVLSWNGSAWVPANDTWGTQVASVAARLSGNGTSGSPLDIAQQGATSGQVLKWNGTSWAPATDEGVTNISVTQSPTNATIESSSGTDGTMVPVNGTNAGLMLPGDKIKVDFISITQAVDLDALETASHAAVTLAGQPYLSLGAGQVITANPVNVSGGQITGTLAATNFPALSGAVTNTAGSLATTLSNNVVGSGNIVNGTVANVDLTTMPAQTIKGNDDGVTNTPQDLTVAEVKTLLAISNVENTALSTWPGSANLTTVGNNAITYSEMQQIAGLSVPGNATNAAANMGTITGTTDQVLRVAPTGTSLGFGQVATGGIADGAVTGTKIAQAGATTGQVLEWNGTSWAPATDDTGAGVSEPANQVVIGTGAGVDSYPSLTKNGDTLKINPGNLLIRPTNNFSNYHMINMWPKKNLAATANMGVLRIPMDSLTERARTSPLHGAFPPWMVKVSWDNSINNNGFGPLDTTGNLIVNQGFNYDFSDPNYNARFPQFYWSTEYKYRAAGNSKSWVESHWEFRDTLGRVVRPITTAQSYDGSYADVGFASDYMHYDKSASQLALTPGVNQWINTNYITGAVTKNYNESVSITKKYSGNYIQKIRNKTGAPNYINVLRHESSDVVQVGDSAGVRIINDLYFNVNASSPKIKSSTQVLKFDSMLVEFISQPAVFRNFIFGAPGNANRIVSLFDGTTYGMGSYSAQEFIFNLDRRASNYALSINQNSKIGIGFLNPFAKVDIAQPTDDLAGGLRLNNSALANYAGLYVTSTGILRLNMSGSDRFGFTGTGRLRIGDASAPTEALEVVGNIQSSGLTGTGTRLVAATSAGVLSPTTIDPANVLLSGGTAGGDLNGTFPNPTVDGIQGVGVSATTPTTNQVLQYNGTVWAPATVAGASPNIDATYNNFGASPAIVTVDNAEGQGNLDFQHPTNTDYTKFTKSGTGVKVPLIVRNQTAAAGNSTGIQMDGGGISTAIIYSSKTDAGGELSLHVRDTSSNSVTERLRLTGDDQIVLGATAVFSGEISGAGAYQITGDRSIISLESGTTSATLPEIVNASPLGANECAAGAVFTLVNFTGGSITVSRAGASDLVYNASGTGANSVSLGNGVQAIFTAAGLNRWTVTIANTGGGATDVEQTITSGSSTALGNTTTVVYVDPASVLATHTITLPDTPTDKQSVRILYGGTVAANSAVVTTLVIAAGSGETLYQSVTPTTANGGDCMIWEYRSSNTKWYRKQ